MKTLFKTTKPSEELNRIAKQYSGETGVRWVWYHTGDGDRFVPVTDKTIVPDEKDIDKILPHIDGKGISFLGLAGAAGLSLREVMAASKALIKTHPYEYTMDVCRTGDAAAVRMTQAAIEEKARAKYRANKEG